MFSCVNWFITVCIQNIALVNWELFSFCSFLAKGKFSRIRQYTYCDIQMIKSQHFQCGWKETQHTLEIVNRKISLDIWLKIMYFLFMPLYSQTFYFSMSWFHKQISLIIEYIEKNFLFFSENMLYSNYCYWYYYLKNISLISTNQSRKNQTMRFWSLIYQPTILWEIMKFGNWSQITPAKTRNQIFIKSFELLKRKMQHA